ncbi:hypothetical protein LLE80_04880, partial [Staphylococcus haemolyticus]|nr:hypothetical protein [Staphylococcus haemolyticus]
LHAAKDEIRSKLMPINRAYHVDKLMKPTIFYKKKKNPQKITLIIKFYVFNKFPERTFQLKLIN